MSAVLPSFSPNELAILKWILHFVHIWIAKWRPHTTLTFSNCSARDPTMLQDCYKPFSPLGQRHITNMHRRGWELRRSMKWPYCPLWWEILQMRCYFMFAKLYFRVVSCKNICQAEFLPKNPTSVLNWQTTFWITYLWNARLMWNCISKHVGCGVSY